MRVHYGRANLAFARAPEAALGEVHTSTRAHAHLSAYQLRARAHVNSVWPTRRLCQCNASNTQTCAIAVAVAQLFARIDVRAICCHSGGSSSSGSGKSRRGSLVRALTRAS